VRDPDLPVLVAEQDGVVFDWGGLLPFTTAGTFLLLSPPSLPHA
jgi:hypothetical protein